MIHVPKDRTRKQPAKAFCKNDECRVNGGEFHFEADHDEPVSCPKCSAKTGPIVGVLTLVHLLIKDDTGPLQGSGGLRYSIECDPERKYIATETNNEAASSVLEAVNCPMCIAESKVRQQSTPELTGDALAAKNAGV